MKRRISIAVLGLILGLLLGPVPAPGRVPSSAGADSASPGIAMAMHRPVEPEATVAGNRGTPRLVPGGPPLEPDGAVRLGLLFLLAAAGSAFVALRLLPPASLVRVLVLGCAPAALLAGGYLLLAAGRAGSPGGAAGAPTALARPVPADPASIARGRAIYAANCATCHGATGRGDGPLAPTLQPRPANLADPHMTAHRDADLYGFISNGIPGSAMAAWGNQLTERERWDLVNYVRSFAPNVGTTAATPAAGAPAVGTRPPARLSGAPIPADLSGQLIYATEGRLWSLDARGGDPVDLTPGRSHATLAAEPALAPDGLTLAFTLVGLPVLSQAAPVPAAPGTDIYVLDLRDGNQRLLLAHDQPGTLIESLNWTPDGRALVYAYSRPVMSAAGQLTGTHREVQRLDLGTGQRATLVPDAFSPALSPDGMLLAYVASDPQTFETTLWLANADGTARRQLVGTQGGFSDFLAPRFSTDSSRIVFSVAGGPGVAPPPPSPSAARLPGRLVAWLVRPLTPRGAAAHGLPGDLWLIGRDGQGLQRLTALYEDQPIGAWAADGQWIAVLGGGGVYFVRTDGTVAVRRSGSGGIGSLVWRDRAPPLPVPGATPQR